jgi:putative Holliday junction resolvase
MIDRTSFEPLYIQVKKDILSAIENGTIRAGEKLKSENEMLQYYGVGRMTIRAALSELTAEGIVRKEQGRGSFCVGLPQNMDGSYGFRSDACRELGEMLKEKTGLQVDFQNERLTTVSAHNILNTVDVRGKKRKAVVDAVSAVLILEDYMNSVKS